MSRRKKGMAGEVEGRFRSSWALLLFLALDHSPVCVDGECNVRDEHGDAANGGCSPRG